MKIVTRHKAKECSRGKNMKRDIDQGGGHRDEPVGEDGGDAKKQEIKK